MTTVIISYNDIRGFNSGWRGDRALYICANDQGLGACTGGGDTDRERASGVMHRISGRYYQGEVPVDDVEQYFIYAGLNAFEGAIALARDLWKQNPTADVKVVACDCRYGEKQRLLQGTGIDMIGCECGGRRTLGEIGQKVLAMAS